MELLNSLSGSPLPNALVVMWLVLLTAMAFAKKSQGRWWYVTSIATYAAALAAKNVGYAVVASNYGEGSQLANTHYAGVLFAVILTQLLSATFMAIGGMRNPGRLPLISLVSMAYAVRCTLDWRDVYLRHDASPVHYAMSQPLLNGGMVATLIILVVMSIVSFVRHSKTSRSSDQ